MKRSPTDDTPVLITEAAPSYDDQLAQRKRKYLIMMLSRIPFLVLAVVFVNIPWLAILLIAISVPLPWMAVLIANDRPALKASKFTAFRRVHPSRELENHDHPVIQG